MNSRHNVHLAHERLIAGTSSCMIAGVTLITTFGTASPPMGVRATLLLYQFAMALFIGLGPLFILCLIFPQTKDLFKRWLMYGIGTTFSMALLSVVVSMVLELTIRVSAALWGAKIINSILGNSTEGLTSVAMQQGGIGLLLTVLIVSVPPMAAMFFQGTLGSFMSYSAFNGTSNSVGPHGQPPGAWTGGPPPTSKAPDNVGQRDSELYANSIRGGETRSQSDAIKPHPDRI